MFDPSRLKVALLPSIVLVITLSGAGLIGIVAGMTQTDTGTSAQADAGIPKPPAGSPAGYLAYSCGVPTIPASEGPILLTPGLAE